MSHVPDPEADSNDVMELLLELTAKANSLYVPVKRTREDGPYAPRSMALDDPALPLEAGVRFVRDRLTELLQKETPPE